MTREEFEKWIENNNFKTIYSLNKKYNYLNTNKFDFNLACTQDCDGMFGCFKEDSKWELISYEPWSGDRPQRYLGLSSNKKFDKEEEALDVLINKLTTRFSSYNGCSICHSRFAIDTRKIPSNQKTFYYKCPNCGAELKIGNTNYSNDLKNEKKEELTDRNNIFLYKDLKCKLINQNSKNYIILDTNEDLSDENIINKVKKYGFEYKDKKFILEVFDLYKNYNLDEGTLYSQSIGRFILSDTEIIYIFQMDGSGFSSRYWQITYEEYINYKNWKDDDTFIRQIVTKRPYLKQFFSRKDLFKIVNKWEQGRRKDYFLEYIQQPTNIIRVFIKEKEDKLLFGQITYRNLAKTNIDTLDSIFSNDAPLYYNGYISWDEFDRESWNNTLCFKNNGEVVAYREIKDRGQNCEELLKEEKEALKSIILEIDKKVLLALLDKVIYLAEKNISDNFNVEFMNTLIERYTYAKEKINLESEINDTVSGWHMAYTKCCVLIGDDREKELLKTLDLVDEQIQQFINNRKKFKNKSNIDEKNINKDNETKEELIDRDNLIKTMALPKNIRSLSEEERNEIICETIIKVSRLLKAIKCDSSEYQLSRRQQATKNNAINKIKAKEFLEAYYEIEDFVDDYGDKHNGKVFEIEKQEINTLMAIIYNDIKQ